MRSAGTNVECSSRLSEAIADKDKAEYNLLERMKYLAEDSDNKMTLAQRSQKSPEVSAEPKFTAQVGELADARVRLQRAEQEPEVCEEERDALRRDISSTRELIGSEGAERHPRAQLIAKRDKAIDKTVRLKNQMFRNADEIDSFKRRMVQQHDDQLAHSVKWNEARAHDQELRRHISILTDQVVLCRCKRTLSA